MKCLFVFAHPDDESFICGGTIAKLCSEGHKVKLLCASKGEAGMIGKRKSCGMDELGKIREKEHRLALKHLGVDEVFYLGCMDGQVSDFPRREFERKLIEIFEIEKPDEVFTFDKDGYTNHPDHKAISRVTTKAVKQYGKSEKVRLFHTAFPRSNAKKLKEGGVDYRAYGGISGVLDKKISHVFDVSDFFEKKLLSWKAHKSQRKDMLIYLKWGQIINMKLEHFQLVWQSF